MPIAYILGMTVDKVSEGRYRPFYYGGNNGARLTKKDAKTPLEKAIELIKELRANVAKLRK